MQINMRKFASVLSITLGVVLWAGEARPDELDQRLESAWRQAAVLLAGGESDEALLLAQRMMRAAPGKEDAWWLLAWVREQRGELDLAERTYRRGLLFVSKSAKLHANLGWTLIARGLPQEAIASLQEAIRLHPKHAEACLDLALAFLDLGKLQDARDAYGKVLETDKTPEMVGWAHNGLAYVHAFREEWREAFSQIDSAIKVLPDERRLQDSLGAIACLAGDFARAEPALRKALPYGAASTRAALAYCLARQGKPSEAHAFLHDIGLVLAQQGDAMDMDAMMFGGLAYLELGDRRRAAILAERMKNRWPGSPFTERLARALREHTGGMYVPVR